jgi:8-oxo-dGTP pyrophosphatase MutT (NUDIX family)
VPPTADRDGESGDGAQRIPRPPDAEPGRPAPWAGLPPAARRGLGLSALVASLERAGRSLADVPPDPRAELTGVAVSDVAALRDSAVLVAAFEEDGETRVVLTRRAGSLRRHRGEVAFPGGRLDAGEPPLSAALREAHEEVGLDPAAVTPVAWLRPLVTFASGSIIRPYVATLAARPALEAAPDEVARVFDVSIAELVADGVFHEERWRRPSPRAAAPDGTFPIYFFDVVGETVWGATARVLVELCCLALAVTPP